MEQYITKIEVPAHIAQSGNGVPAYVMLRTRYKGKYRTAFYEALDLAKELQTLNADETTELEVNILLKQLRQAKALITEAYTQIVVDWNWIDDNGSPLPKPTIPGVVEGELYPEQELWINQQLKTLFKLRGTEGNAPSGGDSSSG
jgi:hypothetical protein